MSILDSYGVSLDSEPTITENDYTTIPTLVDFVNTKTILNAITTNLKNEQSGTGKFLSRDTPQTITAIHNFTNGVSGINKSHVGLSNVNNTSDVNKPISSLTQTALDGLSSDINLKANINNPSFTGNVSGITKNMVGLSNVDDTSDANKPISNLTQLELNLKANINNPSFTGTVSGISKAMVGLSNVENTSDLNKPVSSATQTELDKKPNLANSNTYTGNTNTFNNHVVLGTSSGDTLIINGTTTFNSSVVGLTKSMVGLGNVANTADLDKPVSSATLTELNLKANKTYVDNNFLNINGNSNIGGVKTFNRINISGNGTFNNSGSMVIGDNNQDSFTCNATATFNSSVLGLTKSMVALGSVDNTSDMEKPVSSLQQTAIDTAIANLVSSAPSTLNTLNELATALGNDPNYATTITSQLGLKAPLANPSFTGNVSGITKNMVGLSNVNDTSDANKPISNLTQLELNLKAPLDNPSFTGNVSGISKAMVGLSNVDDTSDANKPISNLTQLELNLKAPLANPSFTGNVSGISKAMVGLSNVDDTSDENKPVSSATLTELNKKPNLTGENTFTQLNTFQGNVQIGTNTADLLTIKSNIATGLYSISNFQFARCRYLDIDGNLSELLDERATLAQVRESNNIWSGTNDYNTSLPRSSLLPANNNDITNKQYVDGRGKEYGPSIFIYGQRCPIQSVSPLVNPTAVTSTQCFLNFSDSNFTIFSCQIEFTYTFVLALAGVYTPSQIFSYNCVYNITNNFGTVTVTPIRVDRVGFGGVPTASNVANGWTLTPLVFSTSLTNLTKVKININFPNIANNGLTTRWIPLTHASIRVMSSKPNGASKIVIPVDFADPTNVNNANRSNSNGGHCYITET